MAIRQPRGTTLGKGTPRRTEGQNGDITIRSTSAGTKMYAKSNNRWHVIHMNMDVPSLKNDVEELLKEVRDMKNTRLNKPTFDAAFLRVAGGNTVKLKNESGVLAVKNADDSAHAELQCSNIKDSNGKKLIEVNPAGSAVNHIKMTNSATTNAPAIAPDGDDTNTDLQIQSKGTGNVNISIPSTGAFQILDNTSVAMAFDQDTPEMIMYKSALLLGKINMQSDAEMRIFNLDANSATTSAHLKISASDDLFLAAGGNDIWLYGGGTGQNGTTFDIGSVFGKMSVGGGSYLTHTATATSTGYKIDSNLSGDDASNGTSLEIDFDRTVPSSGTAGHTDKGINLTLNSASLGTSTIYGMDMEVVGATSGTSIAIGADITVSGADTNIGMIINSPGEHIRMQATADAVNDYATISVADTGDMSIATFGNGVRDSDLTLDIDGKIILEPAGNGVWIEEATASGSDLAGYGQLWIKNSSPNELSFTDDAGTDIVGIGKYMYDIQRIGYYATATASYIPMTGYTIESTSLSSGNERLAFIAPYNGTIEKVQWRSEIAQNGTTSFRILESSDGTEIPGTLTGRVDESIDIADDTTHEVDFSSMTSGDVNLDRGKIYSLYISHPSAPNDTNVTVVFKWDITSA